MDRPTKTPATSSPRTAPARRTQDRRVRRAATAVGLPAAGRPGAGTPLDDAQFRLLAERSRDLIYRYRILPDRGFEYVSPSAVEFAGYTPEDHYADPDLGFKLVHPDDRPILEAAREMVSPDPVVLRWIRRDGSIIWTEQHNVPILDAQGDLVAIEGVARDVTERELARAALTRSEQGMRALLERGDTIAAAIDLDGRITFASAALLHLIARTAEETIGGDVFALLAPEALRAERRAYFKATIADGFTDTDMDGEIVTGDGSVHQLRLHVVGLFDARGRISGVALTANDLTARDQAAIAAARTQTAIDQVTDAVVVTDIDARILYVNPAFERATGYTLEELKGQNPRILHSGRQSPAFYRRMWRTLVSGAAWSGEFVNRRKDGSIFLEEATITPIRDASGAITSYVGVKRDVTRLLALQASSDTAARQRTEIARSIANLRAGTTLEETAERIATVLLAIPGAAAGAVLLFENGNGARVAAVATDLSSAFQVGELLPQERSEYLRERAAHGAWVETGRGRAAAKRTDVRLTADDIRTEMFVPIEDDEQLVGLLVVGSNRSDAGRTISNHLASAIELAAVARSLIGPMNAVRQATMASRQRIEAILARHAFHPLFQPIVEIATGTVIGFEALTRFSDGTRPDLMFAEARAAGLTVELEAATLEAAIAASGRLPAGTWLSLNASPEFILHNGRLTAALSQRSRPVIIEVTEHDPIEDYGTLRQAIDQLGPDVRVAVDDAGAGVANFAHLVELRPHFVKLDVSLVRGVNADVSRQALVVGLRHFAHTLGGHVIAEGIETEPEREALQLLGLNYGQGYLFGRPSPADTWADRRAQHRSSKDGSPAPLRRNAAEVA